MRVIVLLLAMTGATFAQSVQIDKSKLEIYAVALFDVVYDCAKSQAPKEACKAMLLSSFRRITL